jgi:hypothetical protein
LDCHFDSVFDFVFAGNCWGVPGERTISAQNDKKKKNYFRLVSGFRAEGRRTTGARHDQDEKECARRPPVREHEHPENLLL